MSEIATLSPPAATLTLRSGDRVQTLDVPRGTTLLEIAAATDTPLAFVCCRAACGTCLVQVRCGAENLSPMTASERELLRALTASDDARLACRCSILGDVELEPIDESASN